MIEEKTDNNAIVCFSCGCGSGLLMLAHRKNHKIVGWIFVCDVCLKDLLGKTLRIEIAGIGENASTYVDNEKYEDRQGVQNGN